MKEIAIFGAGGFGMEVAQLIGQINAREPQWKLLGYFDDGEPAGKVVGGYPVLGGLETLNAWDRGLDLVLALGIPRTKMAVHGKIRNPRVSYPTLIHPAAIVGGAGHVTIGEGSIVCAGNIITTAISIGRHVILNLACTVGHETMIGDYSSFMPTCNISGEVRIGKGVFFGTGSKIINQKSVGDGATIGAGAVVISDIPEGATAVGVPAKVVKINEA